MSTQFFSKLSQNYIELIDDDVYYDITVEVGKEPNVKILRAHVSILCCRSPYLRRTLTTNKKNKDNNSLAHIKLPNISSEVFQIIIKYMYGANYKSIHGPFFGDDIVIYSSNGDSRDYDNIWCQKKYYEKKIRETKDKFSMDDYEVFQIVKR
ncbi:BTB/POZ protein [Rhizophagus irregularis DAOM 181602=DAOM 197198]|nr:BTB/POZ protein [Rhizophagus irregularis DAOM 181602=DAOM 197198]